MVYVALVFGIFGLFAFAELPSLKRRIAALEEQLAKTEGTPAYEERRALIRAAKTYIGQPIRLELKEDHEDADVMMYGNSKHGSNTILDVDEEWLLVRVDGPKAVKEKLIRLESVRRITAAGE